MRGWENFYVIVGSSGGALIGLQFVVIALVADMRPKTSMSTIHAFGTPTVVHFGGALIISAVMSAPWPSVGAESMALIVTGAIGMLYLVFVARHALRILEYKPVAQDWFWYLIVPALLYVGLLISAFFVRRETVAPYFLVAGVALGLLVLGIRNAWDTVTYIVVGAAEEAAKKQ